MESKVLSKRSVKRAGDILRSDASSEEDQKKAMAVLSEWRGLFYRPINTFQSLVRSKIKEHGIDGAIVAQRLKRTPSIITKLRRMPRMDLGQMQDIGGIRAVLNSIEEVRSVHASLVSGRHNHDPLLPPKDYIAEPKPDGYRSIHQVFKYGNVQHDELEGLRVEVQLRTKLQHYWATAVETLGIIEKSSFKVGMGDEKYKQFFRLASALFSIMEGQPIVASLRDKPVDEIVREFSELQEELSVFEKLVAFANAINAVSGVENGMNNGYYLLMLDTASKKTSFVPFAEEQQDIAERAYLMFEEKEKDNPGMDVVLAAAGDLNSLKKAYPNYFADTAQFIENLQKICTKLA